MLVNPAIHRKQQMKKKYYQEIKDGLTYPATKLREEGPRRTGRSESLTENLKTNAPILDVISVTDQDIRKKKVILK